MYIQTDSVSLAESINNKTRKGKQMNKRHVLTTIAGVLVAIAYITGTAYLLTTLQEDDRWCLILSEAAVAVIFHLIALVKVKRGSLTVYRSWGDFGVSCAWPVSGILAVFMAFLAPIVESSIGKTICQILTIVFAAAACVGLIWMFVGAFNNNKGKFWGGLIALSARITASMMFLTWLSKLLEMKNKYNDSNVGLGDYAKALIGFIAFGIWFKMLVVPLVADNREED
ncbi:MAG: hypothetical protein II823_04575 [Kiritimatiellae bacterium]|nr:hypothetical protein [Kiritimatiellia bacterium]